MAVEFEAICRPKFTKFSVFRLSVSRFVQKIFALKLEVVEKHSKCIFGPQFLWERQLPTFLRQFVRATYYPLLGKVWLSSVC